MWCGQEELENKNYAKVEDASLLRFLVDLRGEDSTTKQLRDDLMTMLIAGHETTAAVLTWALFELTQNPTLLAKVQDGTCAPRQEAGTGLCEQLVSSLIMAQ